MKKIIISIIVIIVVFTIAAFIGYKMYVYNTKKVTRTETVKEVNNMPSDNEIFFDDSSEVNSTSQWRGVNRDGIYNETGLLKEWPADGPELLWFCEELGDGYSSPAIANGKIYIAGLFNDDLVLSVFDLSGKLLIKKIVGKEWNDSYPGARSTINVNEGKLYIFNSLGHLHCLDEKTFDLIWKKDVLKDFDGINIMWGMTEAPLIVGDKVFITPGGEKYNVLALNKNTGDLIWYSEGEGTTSAYCSPLFIDGYSTPIIVTNTEKHVIAFNADTGEKLWSHPQTNTYNIHPNTPIYSDGMVLSITGYGGGAVLLRLKDDGKSIEQVWVNKEIDNQKGGAVKVGDYIYASGHNNKYWFCVDWKTGETMYKAKEIYPCNVIFADGMLYCYSERGIVAFVKPNPQKFEMVSSFKITMGTSQHWAHPVIHDGVLYIRHGDVLMAYKIK